MFLSPYFLFLDPLLHFLKLKLDTFELVGFLLDTRRRDEEKRSSRLFDFFAFLFELDKELFVLERQLLLSTEIFELKHKDAAVVKAREQKFAILAKSQSGDGTSMDRALVARREKKADFVQRVLEHLVMARCLGYRPRV